MFKIPKKYYCTKCKKHHVRGRIYKEHLKYKQEEKVNFEKKFAPRKIRNMNIEELKLRPIAKRQIRRLYKKMKLSNNSEIYKHEIEKIILKESGQ
ncbi:MAG: hypothetical protein EU550_01815 [Promethearchaeota archaeon]|nr:MAG: hypothetical protein EU550_01815 [Candidatus Lokiarchaeota archaeon]